MSEERANPGVAGRDVDTTEGVRALSRAGALRAESANPEAQLYSLIGHSAFEQIHNLQLDSLESGRQGALKGLEEDLEELGSFESRSTEVLTTEAIENVFSKKPQLKNLVG